MKPVLFLFANEPLAMASHQSSGPMGMTIGKTEHPLWLCVNNIVLTKLEMSLLTLTYLLRVFRQLSS